METLWQRLSGKAVEVRPNERRALIVAFLFHFLILAGYYILRPIRDEMGVAGGVENLPWMFTGTLIAMVAANALFAVLVVRFSRRQFIPLAYRFFILNLIVFFLLLRMLSPDAQIWVGRAFFIWVSVFNLFVVSVFWAFMADVFRPEAAKRLFGFIAVGGTLGAIVGAAVTAFLVEKLGAANLLLVSAFLLELAAQCARRYPAREIEKDDAAPEIRETAIGGTFWAGFTHAIRSPYLLGIIGFIFFLTITATFLYFQQATLAKEYFPDRGARTAFFAQVDVAVNVLTILVQGFLTGRLLKWLGVGITLAFLPILSAVGFAAIGFAPILILFVLFQTLRRAGNFALARPAREVLFTVLPREDKYKAKSFIDTFVYRAGDQVGAWSYALLGWIGLGLAGISFVAVPLALGWAALSLWLGRRQAALSR